MSRVEKEFLAEESGVDYDKLFNENNDLTKEDFGDEPISKEDLDEYENQARQRGYDND